MTGTGTQADPFIVDNWSDFRTIGTSSISIYVKWADSENKIINFNDIKPEGFSGNITFPQNVDFNGWTLRNFHSTAGIVSNNSIENLILENFYVTSNTLVSGTSLLKNCILSGMVQCNGNARVFHGCGLQNCSLNLRLSASSFELMDASGYSLPQTQIKNSDIILDISCNSSETIICTAMIKNSRISGKIRASSGSVQLGNSSSMSNVFNIESNRPLKYVGGQVSVYNSDLAEVTSDSSDALKPCTTTQLKSAAYLYELGFPIGVD